MNVRVEFEPVQVRHIAVQCDKCNNWFNGRDITTDKIETVSNIYHSQYICPVCGHVFGGNAYEDYANVKVKEVSGAEVYAGCLKRKEVWE